MRVFNYAHDMPLTELEKQTLVLIVDGYSNTEIVVMLNISQEALKKRLGGMYEKKCVSRRAELQAKFWMIGKRESAA